MVNSLNFEYTILHLFDNAYINNNGKFIYQNCRLRDYFDIAYLIKNRQIDWDKILVLSQKLEITHKIYDVIKSVGQIYNLPDDFTNNIMPKFSMEECNYKLEMVYLGDNPKTFNSGLLIQEHKADASYSIFDKDFCYYEFIRNYKSVLYSKKNDWFLNRLILAEGKNSEWIKYKSYNYDILMYHCFEITKDSLLVNIKIDKSRDIEFKKNSIAIKLEFIDNDISSCFLVSWVYSSVVNIDRSEKFMEISQIEIENLYSGIEYENSIKNEMCKIPPIKINHNNDENFYYIKFCFNREQLFKHIDFICIEVKLECRLQDSLGMSIGGELSIIQNL